MSSLFRLFPTTNGLWGIWLENNEANLFGLRCFLDPSYPFDARGDITIHYLLSKLVRVQVAQCFLGVECIQYLGLTGKVIADIREKLCVKRL